jgi:peptidoglycan hydrolase-like protein with peptidoglycan-binding domain
MKKVLYLLSLFVIATNVASAYTDDPSLSLYSRDEHTGGAVTRLQNILKSNICPDITVTGFFGIKTDECLKAFQKSKSLPSTGYVGPLTKSALSKVLTDSTKAAVVGGSITTDYCGSSDLPIKVIAGPGTSSVISWGSRTAVVVPNVVLPLRAYLNEPFVVSTNYQSSDVTIETNPSSLITSNGVSIKRLSATSFEVTVKDGKFITKGQPEAKLYIRASSSYAPKTNEVYKDGCNSIVVSPNLSADNAVKTPTVKLTDGSNLNWIGVQTLLVEGLVPGAKTPNMCVKGTGSKVKVCEELDGFVGFAYSASFYQEETLSCSPYKTYADADGKAMYYCEMTTAGFNNFSDISSRLRNAYNIYVGKQDVNVSQYDNTKISYQKSNTVQLNIVQSGDSKTPTSYCPSGQVPYIVYNSGAQAPTCTSCDVIPEKERVTFAQCNGVKDPDPKWETSAGSAPKTPGGVIDLGFGNTVSQCGGNTAPGVVGQICQTKGFKCYINNSSSYTIYSCPGSTQVASYLEGKVNSEDYTGALTSAPAGVQVSRSLLIPGFSCSEVVKTDSNGKYRFEGQGGCIALPYISVFKSTEMLSGTTAGQTVFSNPNALGGIRPTSYGAVPDIVIYNNQGYNYTFQYNKVVGNIDTSKCSYDSASQENMRLKRIFTERPTKAPQGTPGTYSGETYWYTSSEAEGYAWIRPYQKCSDPVTGNTPPTDVNRKSLAYVYTFECPDIKNLSFAAYKYRSIVGNPVFYVGVSESEKATLRPSALALIYWSSAPIWTFADGTTIQGSANSSAASEMVATAATKTKAEAYALCGF